MADRVQVIGDKMLAATLRLAAARVTNMSSPGRKAAALVGTRGRAGAPHRSGRLAASIAPTADNTTAEVTSGLAYAARTHWGYRAYGQAPQPFLADPAHQMEPVWMGYYVTEVDRLLGMVRGA